MENRSLWWGNLSLKKVMFELGFDESGWRGKKWEKNDLRQQVLICKIPFQFGMPGSQSYAACSCLQSMARPYFSERSIIFCGWKNIQNFLLYFNGCVLLCALMQAVISLIENIVCNQMNKILFHNLFTSWEVISPFWSTRVHSFCSHLFIHSFMHSLFIHSINMHWAPITCQPWSSCWRYRIEKLKSLFSNRVHPVGGNRW